jgi:hypothetical protein
MSVRSFEPHAFDVDETKLMEELALDLAFGISTLRESATHKQAEEALRYRLPVDVSSAFQRGINMNVILIVERTISPRNKTVHHNQPDFSRRNALHIHQLFCGNPIRQK